MPSKSPKQARFMAAAANNPDFARRAGISIDTAREFHNADKGVGILSKKRSKSRGPKKVL